jgi:hypothetical protein
LLKWAVLLAVPKRDWSRARSVILDFGDLCGLKPLDFCYFYECVARAEKLFSTVQRVPAIYPISAEKSRLQRTKNLVQKNSSTGNSLCLVLSLTKQRVKMRVTRL